MEQLEKDILHVKAGALLQLGMQIGAERQRSSHDAIVGYSTSGADGRIFSRFRL